MENHSDAAHLLLASIWMSFYSYSTAVKSMKKKKHLIQIDEKSTVLALSQLCSDHAIMAIPFFSPTWTNQFTYRNYCTMSSCYRIDCGSVISTIILNFIPLAGRVLQQQQQYTFISLKFEFDLPLFVACNKKQIKSQRLAIVINYYSELVE